MTNWLKRLSNLPRNQQILSGGIALALVVSVLGVMWVGNQTEYAAPFSGLTAADAGAMSAKLAELGIPYKAGPGGTSILVPVAQIDEARIKLAQAGYPKDSSAGFELFDKSSLGLSDAQQKVNAQRAIQGELERTLSKMSGVQGARVLIAAGTDSLFVREKTPATASVLLITRGPLPDAQISTIVHLVASAVPGLKAEAITITDTLGTSYDTLGPLGSIGATSSQLAIKRQYETQLARQITELITPVLGPGKVSAKATIDIDWDQYEKNSITLGDEPQPVSKTDSSEKFTGNTSTVGGVPGVTSNVPGATTTTGGSPVRSAAPGQDYSKTNTTTNFDTSKTVEKRIQAPGTIKKQYVSVFIDRAPVANDPVLEQVKAAVAAAAGIDVKRSDVVNVVALPFDRKAATEAQAAADKEAADARQANLLRTAGSGALVLAVAVFMFFLMRRRGSGNTSNASDLGLLPNMGALGLGESDGALSASHQRLMAAVSSRQAEPDVVSRSPQLDAAHRQAEQDPDLYADVVRIMLQEAETR